MQSQLLAGRRLHVDSPQGRFADGAAELDGCVLERIDAYGKHLFYVFEGERVLHVHLGLFGKFRSGEGAPPPPRGAVRVRFISGAAWVTLSGPTACELIDASQRTALLARIGPDPLRASARPRAVVERITRSAVTVGALLMDQSVIAGIGNVYRAELLFRAGLDPFASGRDVAPQTLARLWQDARRLLRDGERRGRIVTTGDARRGAQYYVYHRTGKPCRVCATPIRSAPLAARTVYWCPRCQPPASPSVESTSAIRLRKPKKPRDDAGQAAAS